MPVKDTWPAKCQGRTCQPDTHDQSNKQWKEKQDLTEVRASEFCLQGHFVPHSANVVWAALLQDVLSKTHEVNQPPPSPPRPPLHGCNEGPRRGGGPAFVSFRVLGGYERLSIPVWVKASET